MRSAVAMASAVLALAALATGPSPATADPAGAVPDAAVLTGVAPLGASDDALREVAGTRILFGHQSVGWNILEGLELLYSTRRLAGPPVEQIDATVPGSTGGLLAHAEIGQNGDPGSKIAAFEELVQRNAGSIDVALMKLCFVDVTAGTDVRAVFDSYTAAMDRIEQRFPGVVLLHATVPLTTSSPEDNVARQRYNGLVRARYGAAGRVVDIARAESTKPGGRRVQGTLGGARYYALWSRYASDDGHLNARGGKRVAAVMAAVIAAAR